MHAVPVTQLPIMLPEDMPTPSGNPVMQLVATPLTDSTHISTQDQLPLLSPPSATIQAPPAVPRPSPFPVADWSVLINKVQAGKLPAITITLHPHAPNAHSEEAGVTPLFKIFTAESASFALEPKPGMLPNCLVNMALNWGFIHLSMLVTDSMNRIETNQV